LTAIEISAQTHYPNQNHYFLNLYRYTYSFKYAVICNVASPPEKGVDYQLFLGSLNDEAKF